MAPRRAARGPGAGAGARGRQVNVRRAAAWGRRLSLVRTPINFDALLVTRFPLPSVPWQLTGNHWVALPCIHPANGAIHVVGALHRGARASVEIAGDVDFMNGSGDPLLAPVV